MDRCTKCGKELNQTNDSITLGLCGKCMYQGNSATLAWPYAPHIDIKQIAENKPTFIKTNKLVVKEIRIDHLMCECGGEMIVGPGYTLGYSPTVWMHVCNKCLNKIESTTVYPRRYEVTTEEYIETKPYVAK